MNRTKFGTRVLLSVLLLSVGAKALPASAAYRYNPDPVLTTIDGYSVSRQTLASGGETGTAWIGKDGPDGRKRLFVSIEHSFPEAVATANAVAHLKAIDAESVESFVERHREWWHAYYPQSFISLDDTRMESFYWIQVYKFGAGARKGRAFMDTMGPWMVEYTAWANGWFNLNTQLSYWFLSTANRLEVAESLFTKLDEKLPTLVANMPDSYGDDCAGMSTIVPQTFISRFPAGRLGFTGELLWTCHDYWLMLQRTMDARRTTENFFPLLKKSVNTYLHFMVEGDDGKVHMPHTRSPEYGGGEDCNFNLALFRWGLRTLVHIDQRYLTKESPPLLMIQGDKDTTIPVKHAYHMQEKAGALEAPVEILIVKNAGHNWRSVGADISPSRQAIVERTVRFFVDHL